MNQNKNKDSISMVLWIEQENMKLLKRFQSEFFNYVGKDISRQQTINLAMTMFFSLQHDWTQFNKDNDACSKP